MGKATRASLWRQSCQKKNTNRFLLDKYEKIRTSWIRIFLSFFFSTKDHVRSPRLSVASGFHSHIRCAPDRTLHRAILRRDPARDRTIFIYIDQTPSDGRTAASPRQERTLSSTCICYDVDFERRRHRPLRKGSLRKPSYPVIMAYGAGHELTWNIAGGENITSPRHYGGKHYRSFLPVSFYERIKDARIQFATTTTIFWNTISTSRPRQKNSTLFRKSKLKIQTSESALSRNKGKPTVRRGSSVYKI